MVLKVLRRPRSRGVNSRQLLTPCKTGNAPCRDVIGSAGPVSSGSGRGTAAGRLQPPLLCGQAAAACGQQQSSAPGTDPAQPRRVVSTRPQPSLPSGCRDSPPPRCPDTAPFSGSRWVLVPESSASSAGGSRAGLEPASPGPGKEEAAVRSADAGGPAPARLGKGLLSHSRSCGAPGGILGSQSSGSGFPGPSEQAGWCQPNQANDFSYPKKW